MAAGSPAAPQDAAPQDAAPKDAAPQDAAPRDTDRSWGWALGLEWSKEPPGLVSLFMPTAEHRGPPGVLHGGLAAAILDETMAALAWALDGEHVVTATLELRFKAPVPLDGGSVRTEAWSDGTGPRRIHKVQGRLLRADGVTAVEATGVFVRAPRAPSGHA